MYLGADLQLNTPTMMEIIGFLLLTIGLWKLFPKMGIKRGKAFIPFYRILELARTVGKEDEGIVLVIADVLLAISAPAFKALMKVLNYADSKWLEIVLVGVSVAILVMVLVYEFRIYYELCKAFHKKSGWVILWMISNYIPAIIWGFDSNVLPLEESTKQAAPLSGVKAEETKVGLSVNVESRATFEAFRRKYLLRDIHMNIKPGRMVLLLGGSGAGKTTLINAIIGYEPAKAKILLNGVDVYKHYNDMKYQIAMVPQQDLMRYDDTVYKTLSDSAVLRLPEEVSAKERSKKVKQVLNEFGLASVSSSEVEKLSGGQRKRLSIAMEFISDPYLFVLDEPDSGLDGVLARDLMTRLRDIAKQGKMVIVITHSPDRVLDLFDDVIVLAKDANKVGRLVFFGSIEESKEFFGTDKMEEVVKMINSTGEGGEGKADKLIEKYAEVLNGKSV